MAPYLTQEPGLVEYEVRMASKRSRLATAIARTLEDALAALRKGAVDEALERLVMAWGQGRVPRLGKLIKSLSDRLEVTPLDGSSDQQRAYLAWCERATPRRAVDVGPLVAAFLQAEKNPKALAHLRTGRFKLLTTFEPDPRIDALCDALPVGGRSIPSKRERTSSATPPRRECGQTSPRPTKKHSADS
jgi:hypothetical protein